MVFITVCFLNYAVYNLMEGHCSIYIYTLYVLLICIDASLLYDSLPDFLIILQQYLFKLLCLKSILFQPILKINTNFIVSLSTSGNCLIFLYLVRFSCIKFLWMLLL